MQYFISCDWGTSTFRLRLVALEVLEVVAETTSQQGIAAVYALWKNNHAVDRLTFYCDVLQQEIRLLEEQAGFSVEGFTIMISGMASSTIGMIDLPYKEIPYRADQNDLQICQLPASGSFPYPMIIVSGVRSSNDVMRGEETILAGCSLSPAGSKELFIFPGTHSKHVVIEYQVVQDFKTYMTGELFELMHNKSILSRSVEPGAVLSTEPFKKGVSEGLTGNLLNSMFHVRTNQLFDHLPPAENYHYLSGLLIGAELKHVAENKNQLIILVSTGTMSALYAEALSVLNTSFQMQDADQAIVKGQALILQQVH